MSPSRQISNPAGVYGLTSQNEQILLECVNQSAIALKHGDVVVVKLTASGQITTTTTAKDHHVLGVVSITGDDSTFAGSTIAIGQPCLVCVGGVARVNIAANTVADGDVLATTTAAGVAGTAATPAVGDGFGRALEANGAKDANNCIRAVIASY